MECLADTVAIIRYFSEIEPLGRKAKEVLEGRIKERMLSGFRLYPDYLTTLI